MAGENNERYRKDDHGRGPWVRAQVRQQPGFTRASDRNHGLYIPLDEMNSKETASLERFLGNVNTEPVVMVTCFFSASDENGTSGTSDTAAILSPQARHAGDAERHAED